MIDHLYDLNQFESDSVPVVDPALAATAAASATYANGAVATVDSSTINAGEKEKESIRITVENFRYDPLLMSKWKGTKRR